jgi:nicotinamide riboside kinase
VGLRINFFGGPGVGKSTLAAQLFGHLKAKGFDVELAQEFIKTWAYQRRELRSFDYVYTFAKQLHAEDLFLQAGVNMVVTDSPMMLQVMYAVHQQRPAARELRHIAEEFDRVYQSINFLVDRLVPYKPQGRYQTPGSAGAMHDTIANYLHEWRIPHITVPPGDLARVIQEMDKAYSIVR